VIFGRAPFQGASDFLLEWIDVVKDQVAVGARWISTRLYALSLHRIDGASLFGPVSRGHSLWTAGDSVPYRRMLVNTPEGSESIYCGISLM
jgi:hypothetical protein